MLFGVVFLSAVIRVRKVGQRARAPLKEGTKLINLKMTEEIINRKKLFFGITIYIFLVDLFTIKVSIAILYFVYVIPYQAGGFNQFSSHKT